MHFQCCDEKIGSVGIPLEVINPWVKPEAAWNKILVRGALLASLPFLLYPATNSVCTPYTTPGVPNISAQYDPTSEGTKD